MPKYTVTLTDPANFIMIATIKWFRQIQGNSLEAARLQADQLREKRQIQIFAYEPTTARLRYIMPDSIEIHLASKDLPDVVSLAMQVMNGNDAAGIELAKMVIDGRMASCYVAG